MLAAMDLAISRVVQALKATKQYENTVIIFSSDVGASPLLLLPKIDFNSKNFLQQISGSVIFNGDFFAILNYEYKSNII